ncbi:co-chaperone GroES [Patescibacteria group bacterium]|nr:MAG: co-chaperone GroES [Patescibacteria group bacterium]
MLLEPFGQRIIVRRKTTEKIGLIHVPESSQKTSLEGEVIAVGPEAQWVSPGDKVLFWKHSGFELPNTLNGYDGCLLMNSEDLLSAIKERG